MLWKIRLIFYYAIVSKLPHSRLSQLFGKLRLLYVSRILHIMPYDKNSKFETNIYISDAAKIRLGKFVRINENVFLQGEIEVGDYVMIAPNVSIYSSTHIYSDFNQPMVTAGLTETKKVVIEDDVWIGRNVVILPGVRIGKGSIVGANAVVNKNVESYSVVGGVPARLLKKRN